MTEGLSGRMEQLESRVDRVESRVNGLATSAQVSELHARIDGLDNRLNARIDGMDNRINARLNDITRVGIGIIITMLISVVGIIVAGIIQ